MNSFISEQATSEMELDLVQLDEDFDQDEFCKPEFECDREDYLGPAIGIHINEYKGKILSYLSPGDTTYDEISDALFKLPYKPASFSVTDDGSVMVIYNIPLGRQFIVLDVPSRVTLYVNLVRYVAQIGITSITLGDIVKPVDPLSEMTLQQQSEFFEHFLCPLYQFDEITGLKMTAVPT